MAAGRSLLMRTAALGPGSDCIVEKQHACIYHYYWVHARTQYLKVTIFLRVLMFSISVVWPKTFVLTNLAICTTENENLSTLYHSVYKSPEKYTQCF